eukprot:1141640-Pelagomonas_calceolata.AAC.2
MPRPPMPPPSYIPGAGPTAANLSSEVCQKFVREEKSDSLGNSILRRLTLRSVAGKCQAKKTAAWRCHAVGHALDQSMNSTFVCQLGSPAPTMGPYSTSACWPLCHLPMPVGPYPVGSTAPTMGSYPI